MFDCIYRTEFNGNSDGDKMICRLNMPKYRDRPNPEYFRLLHSFRQKVKLRSSYNIYQVEACLNKNAENYEHYCGELLQCILDYIIFSFWADVQFYSEGLEESSWPVGSWLWTLQDMLQRRHSATRPRWCWRSHRKAYERFPSNGLSRRQVHQSASQLGPAFSNKDLCSLPALSSSVSLPRTRRWELGVCQIPVGSDINT